MYDTARMPLPPTWQDDPKERRNLADQPAHADRIARMAERIAEHQRAIHQA
jgi:hypothetical protein